MSDRILRNQLIRTAALMPKGSGERRHLLHLLAAGDAPATSKVAIKEETAQFRDWVMLNLDPWSERAMETYLEKLLKRGPSAYVKAAPRRKPPMLVGDMVIPKPEKAPPQNEDVATAFKYMPGTVEKVDGEGVLIKFESGQTARFFGTNTGASTGLYRYTPKAEYSGAETAKKLVEFVYFSKPGEVDAYRKHVTKEYIDRGRDRGEDRKSPYYSGYIINFKVTKDGNTIFTAMTQQRTYPVSVNPKSGRLLYLGQMRKRPNWQSDFVRDVAELQDED